MIVCSCRGVRESTVRAVVGGGARSVDQIAARCGAGGVCGGCHATLEGILAEAAVSAVAVRVTAA